MILGVKILLNNETKSKRKGGEHMATKDIFDEMVEEYPSRVITRAEVSRFTGGLMRGSYLANLDSRNEGPPRQRVGQKWIYPTRPFADWLRARSVDSAE